jgi:hypothetical protein
MEVEEYVNVRAWGGPAESSIQLLRLIQMPWVNRVGGVRHSFQLLN